MYDIASIITLEEIRNPERFNYDPSFLPEAIEFATEKVREIMPDFLHLYPTPCSKNLKYGARENEHDWVEGFWTGMLWLSYELTGSNLFRGMAEAQLTDYRHRLKKHLGLDHHDIGFLYSPSAVAQYKLTGSKQAKKLALSAAELLAKRFSPQAGIIQVRDRDVQGAFIVDCSMNVPLLAWAGKETGERAYTRMALTHMMRVCENIVRENGSTHQCFKIDEVTGMPSHGWQGQGYNNESCWARGQAWVIYGLALAYSYTKEPRFLAIAKRTANYFLNRLPSDLICNWDLVFTKDDDPRDSSSAPIAACGLLELSKYLPKAEASIYHRAAGAMLQSLAYSYTTKGLDSNGLLQHGVYCKDKGQGGWGDDECCIWGDYFYMEGLARLHLDWKPYWY